jgi:hypothetical protein
LWRYQKLYDVKLDWWVAITLEEAPESSYSFELAGNGGIEKLATSELLASTRKFLQVRIPYNYLLAILTRHCHWNNAYHGCLVDWYRRPDEYRPEIQILLSYFHL